MWKTLKTSISKNFWFYALSFTAVALIISSFILPPTGIIDTSVLAAVGEIFAFAALGTLLYALDKNKKATITHKDTSLTVGDND